MVSENRKLDTACKLRPEFDDREGEILRKNQQWTMDVLLVYVEYCISTMRVRNI